MFQYFARFAIDVVIVAEGEIEDESFAVHTMHIVNHFCLRFFFSLPVLTVVEEQTCLLHP